MTAHVPSIAETEAVETYRARRRQLITEAYEDDRNRRPITASQKRQIARVLAMASLSEEIDSQPTGLGGLS